MLKSQKCMSEEYVYKKTKKSRKIVNLMALIEEYWLLPHELNVSL